MALLVAAPGCAPQRFADGVVWAIRTSGTRNAASQPLRGWPCLRANAFILDRFERAQSATDLTECRGILKEALEQSYRLACYAVNNEIDCLPRPALDRLRQRYFSTEADATRDRIRARFWAMAGEQYAALIDRVETAERIEDLHRLARVIRRAALPSPEKRHGHGLLLALIAASIREERGPLDRGRLTVDVYEPDARAIQTTDPSGESGRLEDQLLVRYAPVIVQEYRENPPYDPNVDRIGTVSLTGSQQRPRVRLTVTQPSVYAYWQYTWIHERKHLQLTYTHWFPKHPKLSAVDSEAGDIDGATLRITLDAHQRPALFETVQNCGCYHRCYPTDDVERSSCRQYGGPLQGKTLCVEQRLKGRIDWIVPETVKGTLKGADRPILFSRAAYHGLVGVSFLHSELQSRSIRTRHRYQLRSYKELERLPIDGGFASMFDGNGLVRGAGRLEGWLLALTGMRSAGQPRQRGTQRLYWDQYDFDDPHLLETCLRLPSDF